MKISNKKNVLVICTDQQRYDSLGCNGNRFAQTPHLDAFARESTSFRRHISTNPVCMPSRASFFTGRYPSGHGVYTNGVSMPRHDPRYESTINGNIPTLADVLREAGYHTRSIGKLHFTPYNASAALGCRESRALWDADRALAEWHGPYYGFEHVSLTLSHGDRATGHHGAWLRQQFPEIAAGLAREPAFRFMKHMHEGRLPVEAHHSTWIGNETCGFLDSHRPGDQPFFLYVSFPDPHHPFAPPADLARQFEQHEVMPWRGDIEGRPMAYRDTQRAKLPGHCESAIRLARQYTDAMVHLIDRNVGRILSTLKARGLFEDTIIIFTSDHGDFLGDFGLLHKDYMACDVLNHVPFLLRAPGVALPAVTHVPMSNADVLPTLCDLLSIAPPEGVQGRSIMGAVNGESVRLVPVYAYHPNPQWHNFSVYDARYRFTFYPGTGERELFDHAQDPHELTNRAGDPAMAGVERELYAGLLELHLRNDSPVGNRLSGW